MDLASLKINASRIESGGWIGNIPGVPGLAFKVRGRGNRDYKRLQARLEAKITRKTRLDPVEYDEARRKIEETCLLETCLLDWRGFVFGGVDLPFSRETASRFFTDPDYAAIVGLVRYAADMVVTDEATDEPVTTPAPDLDQTIQELIAAMPAPAPAPEPEPNPAG